MVHSNCFVFPYMYLTFCFSQNEKMLNIFGFMWLNILKRSFFPILGSIYQVPWARSRSGGGYLHFSLLPCHNKYFSFLQYVRIFYCFQDILIFLWLGMKFPEILNLNDSVPQTHRKMLYIYLGTKLKLNLLHVNKYKCFR